MWQGDKNLHGDSVAQTIDNLYEALNHFEIKEDVVCYRGACSYDQFASQFNLKGEDLKNEAILKSLIGKKYDEKGFTSFTGARRIGSLFQKDVHLEVCVPKGTHGLYISAKGASLSQYGEAERELLLVPTQMEILDCYYEKGQFWVRTCIVSELPRLP